MAVVSGTFGATGQSASYRPTLSIPGQSAMFNVSIYGTFVGTVAIQRQVDGTNWVTCSTDGTGTAASYTTFPITVEVAEDEPGIPYRLNCTAYTSGTASYRISP